MASLFISYSRKDIDFARKLTDAFQGQDLDFWIDWEDIPPTVEWWQEIQKGIEEADIFLFLLSPDSAKSKVCKQEIEHATQNGKRLIPIVVKNIKAEDAPLELSHLNWIFFQKSSDFNVSLQKLTTAIETDYEWVQIHRRLQVRALEWERGSNDNSFLLRGKDLQDAEAQLVANSSKNPNPTNLQTDYVLKSRQASNRQRRITTGIAIAGLVTLAALAVYGFIQATLATDNATEAQNQAATAQAASTLAVANEATAVANENLAVERAKIARARELAAQSVTLQDRNFQNSLLLGVEAFQLVDNAQTLGAMLDNIRSNPQLLKIITGHSNAVNSVAFSPDGEILASGSSDNTIILWDVATGQPIGEPLKGHSDFVTSVAFSPDGGMLVSGGSDKKIILWDVKTRQAAGKPLTGHSSSISEVTYSPNGKFIVSGDHGGTIILWDATTGQTMGQPLTDQSEWIWNLAISSDNRTIASASNNVERVSRSPEFPPTVILWDIRTRQSTWQPLLQLQQTPENPYGFNQHGMVWNVAFSPDGRTLASGTTDGAIILWDMVTKKRIGQPLIGHTSTVTVAFSPDGNKFASASDDGTIILWDANTGQPIGNPFRGHSREINSIAFSPDGKILASGSDDNSIILWNVSDTFNTNVTTDYPIGEEVEGVGGSQLSMVFSPDGRTLASGNIFAISFWDMTTHPPVRQSSNSGGLDLYRVSSLAFSPDGKTLISADEDQIILWDATSREPIIEEPFEEHSDTVNSVAYSPDGKTIASASDDHTIILWDVTTQQSIGEPLTGHSGPVNSVTFSPDNKILASGSDDNSIILWDVSTLTAPKILTQYSIEESSVGHSGSVNSVVFSSDGKLLASASDDNSIILWDLTTNKPIGQPLTGHLSRVSNIAFSPDNRILASASSDITVILWDIETGQPIGQPLRGSPDILYGVAFSPDGKTLVSGGATTTLIFWDLDPQSWIKIACQRAGRNFSRNEWKQYFPDEEYRKTCDQWPIDFGNFRQILEDTIVNLNEPEQVQEALNKVRKAMEMDSTSVVEDPASEASEVVTEWIATELLKKLYNEDWQETSDLLDQFNTAYENLPVNFPLVKQKIAGEIESEVLSEAKAGNWKKALEMLERISTSFENLPVDFNGLEQSIENMVRNEIPKEVDSGNWQNVLKLLDVVEEKRILIDDANLLNKICWNGSLNGYASNVLEYCEYAVEFVEFESDEANIRDSRGLARALTGDFEGAIDDFQYFVDNFNGSSATKREHWIIDLKAGRNPFTEEVLNDLQ